MLTVLGDQLNSSKELQCMTVRGPANARHCADRALHALLSGFFHHQSESLYAFLFIRAYQSGSKTTLAGSHMAGCHSHSRHSHKYF